MALRKFGLKIPGLGKKPKVPGLGGGLKPKFPKLPGGTLGKIKGSLKSPTLKLPKGINPGVKISPAPMPKGPKFGYNPTTSGSIPKIPKVSKGDLGVGPKPMMPKLPQGPQGPASTFNSTFGGGTAGAVKIKKKVGI